MIAFIILLILNLIILSRVKEPQALAEVKEKYRILRKHLIDTNNEKFHKLKPIGSVAYKLGLTAANKADMFASLRPKNEWDICAGNCIINESGGKLIDLNGKRVIFNRETTLIQPGLIAGEKSAVDKTLTILK